MFFKDKFFQIALGLGLICCWCLNMRGQRANTANTGVLYVSPETLMSVGGDFSNAEAATYRNDGEVLLKGSFDNEGITDFIREGGLTRFEGNAIQDISGSEPAYFYDVLFDNQNDPVPFHLSGIMSIVGGASFYNGIVDNEHYPGIFEMGEEAYHFNTVDGSHVNGPVHRVGRLEFTYPVGKQGYYRPAGLASLSNPDAYFEGEYFFKNSDVSTSPHRRSSKEIERIDDQQYWNIVQISPGEEDDLMLSLSYRAATTPDFIMRAIENEFVTIVRWNEETHLWENQGGVVDFEKEVVTAPVDGEGLFTFATLAKEHLGDCGVIVYNALTPNGDGINDYFRIESEGDCAETYRVKIFNRWGVKVFESDDYGRGGDVFDGYSTGRATVNKKHQLPTGTYYYILEYDYNLASGERHTEREAGYLYLSSDR